jgi:hypothetical protein
VVVPHGDSLLDGSGRQDGLQTDQHYDGFFHWFLFVTPSAYATVSFRYFSFQEAQDATILILEH